MTFLVQMLIFILFYSFVLKAMSLKYQNVMFANVDVDSSKVSLLNPLCRASEPECNVTTLSHSAKVMTSPG